ncbi:AzlD domain-containing protein [Nocardioides dongxiaopingii]|uniref:AzlD domain-containing protein n=1 Tax=Nocardioides dongxiaopingii TaxID=2576036 RepID=UPI0010C76571|nr:AzlD domain-containing protein [Nocardioides dongxiaopingii]
MNLSEAQVWLLIAGLVGVAVVTKGIGPAVVGDRPLPGWSAGVIAALAPALLAALVATALLADGRRLAVGAEAVGVAVATVLLLCRAPLLAAAAAAVLVTVLLRALV